MNGEFRAFNRVQTASCSSRPIAATTSAKRSRFTVFDFAPIIEPFYPRVDHVLILIIQVSKGQFEQNLRQVSAELTQFALAAKLAPKLTENIPARSLPHSSTAFCPPRIVQKLMG